MSTRVTIQDIADALGISRNTVSKAINNSDGIAAATRDKILAKAAEMGYRQFSYVQTLSSSWRGLQEAELLPGVNGEIALLTTLQFNESHFAVTMIDRLGRELSQFDMPRHDTGNRRRGVQADEFVVVDADDLELFWQADVSFAGCDYDITCNGVVYGK